MGSSDRLYSCHPEDGARERNDEINMSQSSQGKATVGEGSARRPVNGARATPAGGRSNGSSRWAETIDRFELTSVGIFLREFITDPRSIGAVVPSSRQLARRMAAFVPNAQEGLVVDLGTGTGVVTAALLEQGIPPERLVAVERSSRLVRYFKERFPQVAIIEGDAQRLGVLLKSHFGASFTGVDFVISSLPLRVMPQAMVAAIEEQVHHVLNHHGRFIQFTYDLRPVAARSFDRLNYCTSRMVWYNLPPARVDVFSPKRNGSHRPA